MVDVCARQSTETLDTYCVVDSSGKELRWVKLVEKDWYWDTQEEDWKPIDDNAYVIDIPDQKLYAECLKK